MKKIDFEGSFSFFKQCPSGNLPEMAFIGRSNVGKSSLINYIMDRKDMARVSKKPGKTVLLNFFNIDDKWRIVDLPGYGYAVASKSKITGWDRMVKAYFLEREQLHCVFVLIDGNIDPQTADMEYISWLGDHEVPMAFIFTKMDKSKPKEYMRNVENFQKLFLESWESMPPFFLTSAQRRMGREDILDFIHELTEEV